MLNNARKPVMENRRQNEWLKQNQDKVLLKVLEERQPSVELVLDANGNVQKDRPGPSSLFQIESIFDELPDTVLDNPEHYANTSDSKPLRTPDTKNFSLALDTRTTASPSSRKSVTEHPRNPWAWWTIRDLFALCGPLLTGFLLLQAVSATVLTQYILRFVEYDRFPLNGALIVLMLVLDWGVLRFQRGKHYKEIFVPLCCLGAITILPGVAVMGLMKMSMLQ